MKIVKQKSKNAERSDKHFSMEQIWMCLQCEQNRQWGVGPSQEPRYLPFLNCARDGRVTRHIFVGLDSETSVETVKGVKE